MRQRIALDRQALTVTILVTAALLFLCAMPLWFPLSTLWLAIPAFYLLVSLYAQAPVAVVVTDDAVVIDRVIGKKRTPLADIERVERMPRPDLSWRLMGSGGFMGYWGLFRSRTLGRFHAYVGRPRQSVLLLLRQGRPVVFSCADPDAMCALLRQRLGKG